MKPKIIFQLSHELNIKTPAYGGKGGFSRKISSHFKNGQSSCSEEWSFKNHIGTHVDFPSHFIECGKGLSAYDPEEFFFQKVHLCDLPLSAGHLIVPEDLEKVSSGDFEMLLFRSGFEIYREDNSYWQKNPGFHPESAAFLLSRFPKLRAIGFDFISLTSYQNRELGHAAHKAFLASPQELLIIEDMHLAECLYFDFSVVVAPLLVSDADGSPVTVYGYL